MHTRLHSSPLWIFALCLITALAGCGGGGESEDSGGGRKAALTAAPPPTTDSNAPQLSGNTATDGFNWVNFRRQQLGLNVLVRNARIDSAAQGHSNYQKLNDTITHEQTAGKPGFTGVTLLDRLTAANYEFTQNSYAYGEVISAMGDSSGVTAAESLIAAIYHRFVVFEPKFLEAGAGAATVSGGYTYFTLDFAANGLNNGLGRGGFVVYPLANQGGVPINFFSDNETPDPVAERNEVGYPVSVHANIDSTVTVQTFTIRARGGLVLPTKLLVHGIDPSTPASAAAIIPLGVLSSATTYDVQFVGSVDGLPVTRNWSFTTR